MADRELREELIKARASLLAQLDAIADRKRFHYRQTGGPPEFDAVESTLIEQLHEIEDLLGIGRSSSIQDGHA